ncbi:MAG: transposase [Candidatus Thermoplasmatota archaeon]
MTGSRSTGVKIARGDEEDCDHREAADLPTPRGRPPEGVTLRDRKERVLRTKRGKALYAKRRESIEPTFSQIKDGRRIDRFLLRGNEKAHVEWKVMALGQNTLKMQRPQTG